MKKQPFALGQEEDDDIEQMIADLNKKEEAVPEGEEDNDEGMGAFDEEEETKET